MIFGTARNGDRLQVAFGDYTGPAGIRTHQDGREVAFLSSTKPRNFPLVGTIDGEAATATELRKSQIPGFVVLWVPNA